MPTPHLLAAPADVLPLAHYLALLDTLCTTTTTFARAAQAAGGPYWHTEARAARDRAWADMRRAVGATHTALKDLFSTAALSLHFTSDDVPPFLRAESLEWHVGAVRRTTDALARRTATEDAAVLTDAQQAARLAATAHVTVLYRMATASSSAAPKARARAVPPA